MKTARRLPFIEAATELSVYRAYRAQPSPPAAARFAGTPAIVLNRYSMRRAGQGTPLPSPRLRKDISLRPSWQPPRRSFGGLLSPVPSPDRGTQALTLRTSQPTLPEDSGASELRSWPVSVTKQNPSKLADTELFRHYGGLPALRDGGRIPFNESAQNNLQGRYEGLRAAGNVGSSLDGDLSRQGVPTSCRLTFAGAPARPGNRAPKPDTAAHIDSQADPP